MSKKILITGITGMDGSNLADFLINNTDNIVYGMVRRTSTTNKQNIKHLLNNSRVKLMYGDLSDQISIDKLVDDIKPDYFINFAANSFVGCAWNMPHQMMDINALGVMRCLESIKRFHPNCKFYSSGSSEEWGDVIYIPQNLDHPKRARSIYGASKVAAGQIVKVYRESYNLYAVHCILFNHEGIRRGYEFVTRKITQNVARIYHSIKNNQNFEPLEIGNLNAKRDWSDSEDFVRGIWYIMNQEIHSKSWNGKPKEYVLSSQECNSVRDFIQKSFEYADIDYKIVYENTLEEKFIDLKNRNLVVINKEFYRPNDVNILLGDSSFTRNDLNWVPNVSFDELVKKMTYNDIKNFSLD